MYTLNVPYTLVPWETFVLVSIAVFRKNLDMCLHGIKCDAKVMHAFKFVIKMCALVRNFLLFCSFHLQN